ncbi:MAG: DNA-directed RNA polymerase subunit alpha [Spirochaetaceae bacterium]|jgi:DNA-directed RNA polymerase subunit alpha|nr:DNA-directed RNA polymerase subunit alpha [Spirochaetaceae bacterium]
MARKNLLKGFKKPKTIQFETLDVKGTEYPAYGKFSASPFEPGFGTTIGNTLRRILLSSIQGYAITSVRITSYDADDVPHTISSEFEAIPNVVEDTIEILNSLKQLRLRLTDDLEMETFSLEFKGQQKITSDMFNKPGHLEVLSKNTPLFTMMQKAHLELEFQVELGRGYVPAEVNERNIDIVGTIPMDAIFTPVPKVKYTIEPCRVGQRNDYDKLILELWTDGTVSPEDALGEAAKIAKEHFSKFINFDDSEVSGPDDSEEMSGPIRDFLNTSIDELELSVRPSNCFKNANIKTLGELTRFTEEDLARFPNLGKISLEEIKQKLKKKNLWLGMTDYSHLKYVIENKKKEAPDES